MKKVSVALSTCWVLYAATLVAQFQPGPCLDLPELGPGFDSQVGSEVVSETGGGLRYRWLVTVLPDSKRTVPMVVFIAPKIALDPTTGWHERRSVAVDQTVQTPVLVSVSDLKNEAFDISPQHPAAFAARSALLPSVGLVRMYPRRPSVCMPNTPEEKAALEKKGWTQERIAEKLSELTLMDFYTVRKLALVPAFPAGSKLPKAEALFATALNDLGALEDYLAVPLDPRKTIPQAPWPSKELQGTDLSLDALRQKALLHKNFREEHRSLIDQLYNFYAEASSAKLKPSGQ